MHQDHPDKSTQRSPAVRSTPSVPTVAGAPNPQGKGQVGFLKDWEDSTPRNAVAKPAPRLLADYFTSLLVLSASFKFKPAVDVDYYLYREYERWLLSPISPAEWNTADKRRAYVGRCVMHEDATWSIDPSDNRSGPNEVATSLAEFFEQFSALLRTTSPLENELPVYVERLPYYQRLYAAALSRSLKESISKGSRTGVASTEWLLQMPHDAARLLTSAGALSTPSPATDD